MKKVFYSLALILIGLLFSFKLLDVPLGLTVDEASFGYNAVLLSNTLYDENGKLLPIFVLSDSTGDFRQPVTQYFIAGFFKIFGASVFNLRLTSVLIVLISTVLIFLLGKLLMGEKGGLISALIFLSTPLIMIQSHLALDNIAPIPFTLLWLFGLFQYQKTGKKIYLILAGVSLGLSLYSYKAMRAIVPVWFILTLIFFWKEKIRYFILGFLPFILIAPLLNYFYPGAILAGQKAAAGSVYDLIFPFLSSFDPSFLFLKGDQTIYHSTGVHGMFLLTTLPLFLIGVYQSIKKKKFWIFISVAFFLAPLFFGLVNSTHRASRLMALIPEYCFITALGTIWLIQNWNDIKMKTFSILIFLLIIINFFDFLNYYWFTYPKSSENFFGKLEVYKSYQAFSKESKDRNLKPFISADLATSESESGHFFESIYFGKLVDRWSSNEVNPPGKSILLTTREDIPGLKRLDVGIKFYNLQINEN